MKKRKSFSGVGPLTKENGETINDPVETAEALKKQYEKVFSKPDENMKVNDPKEFFKECNRNINIDSIYFTEQDIREAINQLSAKAAAGPDGVPALLLKKCRDSAPAPAPEVDMMSYHPPSCTHYPAPSQPQCTLV